MRKLRARASIQDCSGRLLLYVAWQQQQQQQRYHQQQHQHVSGSQSKG
jgi:hypothetical protein